MLQTFLFFLTIFSSSLTVIISSSGQPQIQAQAPVAKDNVQQTEQRIKTPGKKEVTSPYANMTQAQINQVKRYDCRLRHRLIPHDYEKEVKKIASATTVKKEASKLQK